MAFPIRSLLLYFFSSVRFGWAVLLSIPDILHIKAVHLPRTAVFYRGSVKIQSVLPPFFSAVPDCLRRKSKKLHPSQLQSQVSPSCGEFRFPLLPDPLHFQPSQSVCPDPVYFPAVLQILLFFHSGFWSPEASPAPDDGFLKINCPP